MRVCEIAYGGSKALEEAGSREDLRRQRRGACVVAGKEHKPLPRMPRGDSRQQVQIVVDDTVGDWLAAKKDHACPWHPQEKQEAQHALLVMMSAGNLR
jgi:hypothetical protein